MATGTLTGSTVAARYKSLLKLTGTANDVLGADASAKYIEDGLGTDTALSLSTNRVGIGTASPNYELEVLPGAHDAIRDWDAKGYHIIITTGRKESMREATEKQLQRAGIFYSQLVIGFGGAVRYIINDTKVNSDEDTCFAVNVKRNKGLVGLKI